MARADRSAARPVVLILGSADVCRTPIVEATLRDRFAGAGWLDRVDVRSMGSDASDDGTMCDVAAARIGYTPSALAFYGAFLSRRLTAEAVDSADLILTAERAHRSAAVRLVPGVQAKVFTWKEALLLVSAAGARADIAGAERPADLAQLAHQLHATRGSVPVAEPSTGTGPFHWRRAEVTDPLTVVNGHGLASAQHVKYAREARSVAEQLADGLVALAGGR